MFLRAIDSAKLNRWDFGYVYPYKYTASGTSGC